MTTSVRVRLAIDGGPPVRTRVWPNWPRVDASTQRNVLDALHSTKWAISGLSERTHSYERRFGEEFAAYIGASFGVPCSSGTAALTIALQALGIAPGDEVIVPGLTWVACASSVCNLGAIPVLVDVDPLTLCLSPEAVRAALTPHTRAIMVVHLYSSFADISALQRIADDCEIPLLEDCSQAHGAVCRGTRAGRFGIIAAFSLQQSKLLTAGEGGIAITNDERLYDRMQQFRADGRRYRRVQPDVKWNWWELEYSGDVVGRNLCMNEFSAAAVLGGLAHLDAQNELRATNFRLLRRKVERTALTFVETADQCERPTFYRLCGRIDRPAMQGRPIEEIAAALAAELLLPIEPIDRPLNDHPLYRPLDSAQVAAFGPNAARLNPKRFLLPVATEAAQTCIGLPHQCLLGDESDLDDIVAAIRKVLA